MGLWVKLSSVLKGPGFCGSLCLFNHRNHTNLTHPSSFYLNISVLTFEWDGYPEHHYTHTSTYTIIVRWNLSEFCYSLYQLVHISTGCQHCDWGWKRGIPSGSLCRYIRIDYPSGTPARYTDQPILTQFPFPFFVFADLSAVLLWTKWIPFETWLISFQVVTLSHYLNTVMREETGIKSCSASQLLGRVNKYSLPPTLSGEDELTVLTCIVCSFFWMPVIAYKN